MTDPVFSPSSFVPLSAFAWGAEGDPARPVTRDDPLPVADPLLNEAIRSIAWDYGKVVKPKGKTLRKFGRTINTTSASTNTVATFLGDTFVENYSTTNDIDKLVCENDSVAGPILFEGHYFDENEDLVFGAEIVTATGQTPASLSRSYCRGNRLKRGESGTFASPIAALSGRVFAYASAGVDAPSGVPDTPGAVKVMIAAGKQQSEKCASSLSAIDFMAVSSVSATVTRQNGSGIEAELDIEYRRKGGVFLPMGLEMTLRRDSKNSDRWLMNPYEIIPSNADFAMSADVSADDTKLTGRISGYLLEVTGDVE